MFTLVQIDRTKCFKENSPNDQNGRIKKKKMIMCRRRNNVYTSHGRHRISGGLNRRRRAVRCRAEAARGNLRTGRRGAARTTAKSAPT